MILHIFDRFKGSFALRLPAEKGKELQAGETTHF